MYVNKKISFFKNFLSVTVGTGIKCVQSEFTYACFDVLQWLQQQWLLIVTIKVQGLCQVADFGLTKHPFGGCFCFVDFNI